MEPPNACCRVRKEPTLTALRVRCRLRFEEIRAASELCTAAAQGNVDLIRRYIRAGINVDAADYDKRTALHIAAADGSLEVVSAFQHIFKL